MLPIDSEVQVLKLGPQNTPYTGKCGRVVNHAGRMLHVILDDDPIPRWRDIGIYLHPNEVRCIDDCD